MDDEDLILEGLKNSLEAGASAIDIYVDGCSFSIVDDGRMDTLPAFREGFSSKGERRGRGLYLLSEVTGGRCGIRREKERTCLSGTFSHRIAVEKVLPYCFNLFPDLVFHRLERGREIYVLSGAMLESRGIDVHLISGLAHLKRIIREKEQRSL